jgi:hypothetical protein
MVASNNRSRVSFERTCTARRAGARAPAGLAAFLDNDLRAVLISTIIGPIVPVLMIGFFFQG